MKGIHYSPGTELETFDSVFPHFRRDISGKSVIDFGCGLGYQCIAMAQAGAGRVLGVDLNEVVLRDIPATAAKHGVADRVSTALEVPAHWEADVVTSKNSFEHFVDAKQVLATMRSGLRTDGKIFITFGPPWFAPWGSHMAYFCRLPWVNVFFSEKTILSVRNLFRPDHFHSYRDVGLAEMTLAKFERIIREAGMDVEYLSYDCIHGMNWLAKTPLREFFVNRVNCILVRR